MSMSEERIAGELPEAQSSSLKMALGVAGTLLGIAVVICGGVAGYVALTTTQPAIDPNLARQEDPAQIRELAQEIALIDLPEGFKPIRSMRNSQVWFGREPGDGALMKMGRTEFSDEQSANEVLARIPFILQTLERGDENQSTVLNPEGISPETNRELMVLGMPFPFRFNRGSLGKGKVPVIKAVGGFLTRKEFVLLIVTLPAAEYDERAIVQIIESIRHPHGEPAVSMDYFGGTATHATGAKAETPITEPVDAYGQTDSPDTRVPEPPVD